MKKPSSIAVVFNKSSDAEQNYKPVIVDAGTTRLIYSFNAINTRNRISKVTLLLVIHIQITNELGITRRIKATSFSNVKITTILL